MFKLSKCENSNMKILTMLKSICTYNLFEIYAWTWQIQANTYINLDGVNLAANGADSYAWLKLKD